MNVPSFTGSDKAVSYFFFCFCIQNHSQQAGGQPGRRQRAGWRLPSTFFQHFVHTVNTFLQPSDTSSCASLTPVSQMNQRCVPHPHLTLLYFWKPHVWIQSNNVLWLSFQTRFPPNSGDPFFNESQHLAERKQDDLVRRRATLTSTLQIGRVSHVVSGRFVLTEQTNKAENETQSG